MSTTLILNISPSESNVRTQNDWVLRTVMLASAVISVLAYTYYARSGHTLDYPDAIAHQVIARRVIDSPTSGIVQWGNVWLPLPHFLSLPLIWVDAFYFTGFAGSVVSMLSYIVATVYIYKLVQQLTGSRAGAAAAAAMFALNPNILYMQSTPMTELLLFATVIVTVYFVQRWIQTEHYTYLMGAGIVATLACLTRYEAWVITFALVVVVALVSMRRYNFTKASSLTLLFGLASAVGISLWIVWNLVFFGNPLGFQNGEYSKPSIWVSVSDPAIGHWVVAAKTYWFATLSNIGWVAIVVALAGIVVTFFKKEWWPQLIPTFALLGLVPFFIYALYAGQRPLHVVEINGDMYNVRFGLFMALPVSIFIGCLVSQLVKVRTVVTSLIIIGAAAQAMTTPQPALLKEPIAWLTGDNAAMLRGASMYMGSHYGSGRILSRFFLNENILFDAIIPPTENVYEGSYLIWGRALKDPISENIEWIIMRVDESDPLYTDLAKSPAINSYQLMYDRDGYRIYQRK